MKNFWCLFLLIASLTSCDDGDLIVTDFNFENDELQWCDNVSSQVLFNINNEGVHEAIALKFELETPEPGFFSREIGTERIPLNEENRVVYRIFDAPVEDDYFCSSIPPVAPDVTEEYQSAVGGEIVVTTVLNNTTDHDSDEVPSDEEGLEAEQDTDEDGIPDYLDIDDDADNILTRVEVKVEAQNNAMGFPDSDADDIPDYLDPDDDNDNTLTRLEDWNMNLNPADDQNEENIPHYLNPDIIDAFQVTGFRENIISRSFRYYVALENLTLVNQGASGGEIRLQSYELGYFDSPTERILLEPIAADQ